MYICSVCKSPVIVVEEKIIKICECKGPVIADMSATAKGTGNIKF